MIELSILTEGALQPFREKKIFIYSRQHDVLQLYKIFKRFDLEVIGYCIDEKEFQPNVLQVLKNKAFGLSYVKPSQLESFLRAQNGEVLVQKVGATKEHYEQLETRLLLLDVDCSPLLSGEIIVSFDILSNRIDTKTKFFFQCENAMQSLKRLLKKILLIWKQRMLKSQGFNGNIFVCSPPKTADHSLNYTFERLKKVPTLSEGNNKPTLGCLNLWHEPYYLKRKNVGKLLGASKIIMGVREPISQNLSMVFHVLSTNTNLTNLFYRELFETYPAPDRKALVIKYNVIFQQSLDVQVYWDIYTGFYTSKKLKRKKQSYRIGLIQDFILEFKECVLDITDYPFNREKGYTIIKDGNTEIFVYQLEKLNNLVPELSEWVGVPFDKLEKGNEASDKWIAESYKQAQKEIKISQEYFDKCFNESYVKHCYSEADIEKFKARWRPHIKSN